MGGSLSRSEDERMRTHVFRLVFCLLLLAGLSLPLAAMSVEEEIQIGGQAASQFEAKYGVVTDPAYTGRLNRVVNQMMPYVQRKDLPWSFKVINVDEFNAAAFPGGFVYATRGLMDGLTDEELAFVVGHEMGHVDHRHSVKQLESNQLRRIGLIAIAAGASGGRITDTTATLVSLADGVISSQYSKADESESDRYGLTLMAQAGFDPAFALSALQKLAAQSGGGTPGFLNALVGSHPLPKERVAQGVALIPTVPYQATAAAPVNGSNSATTQVRSTGELLLDGTSALEYTLSLWGHGHSASLQKITEGVALGHRAAPAGTRQVRVSGSRSEGLARLEDKLLASSELRQGKRTFGVALVERSQGRLEAVVLLQGGR